MLFTPLIISIIKKKKLPQRSHHFVNAGVQHIEAEAGSATSLDLHDSPLAM